MIEHPAFDPLTLLVRRWRIVAACAVLGAAAGLVYGFIAPKWYEAQLTVVPSQRNANTALSALAGMPGADLLGLGGSTDVQRIQAVLESNSVTDAAIEQFHLQERYDTDHVEHTRLAVWEHCHTNLDRKSNVVSLVCEDKDPQFARDLTAFFGEEGNRVFGRISASSAREERRFLETQVVNARKEVDDSSRKLREFQEQHRVIDLPEQAKAVISAMASIEGELVSKQLELSYLSTFSSRGEANVVQLEKQVSIMQSKLTELESSSRAALAGSPGAGSGSAEFFPGAMRVPELRYELEQLFREQKIRETVFFLLTQRYETARVDEARDTSTFQILDHPTVPTYKSRPRRLRIAIMGVGGGLAFAAAWILLPAWWSRRRGVEQPA